MELYKHTINFFNYFKVKQPLIDKPIDDIVATVIDDGAMDLNMIIGSSSNNLKLWVDHFNMPPGWFFTIQELALEWQKTYQGLSERSWRRVDRARQRDEKIRSKLGCDRASSVVTADDND
jgi:hypothetical protein